ncbi:MAG: hypothetical protein H5T47_02805, partial [Archaeoglobi archaeon]|nr:hypothetical protein [Candidatus Mnemosynella bozhongmuii]
MNAEGALKRCLARKGSSLLIRGSPGSGKTLMALSLISSHEGDFFYIST